MLKRKTKISKTPLFRPRALAIADIYNISHDLLFNFLRKHGYKQINVNTILEKNTLFLIESEFYKDRLNNKKIEYKIYTDYLNTLYIKDTQLVLETEKEPVLYLNKDIFNNVKQVVYLNKETFLNSYFSNSQAINICSKMTSSYTRNLCKQIGNLKFEQSKIYFQIHYIANKALEIFGSKLLTFIHDLRNINFKNQTANEIQTYQKVIPDFPMISFISGNTSFKVSFFVKQIKKSDKLKADIRLYSSNNFEEIGAIDKDGYIMIKLKKYRPSLTLYYELTKNNKFEIFSGVETGLCEDCKRPLSHPTSLRIGLGPVCAKNHKLDSFLYNFG